MANCIICAEFDNCPWRAEPNAMCSRYRQREMTNGDRIRAMTDKELAEFFVKKMDYICKKKDRYCDGLHCVSCTIDWLREEATDEQS